MLRVMKMWVFCFGWHGPSCPVVSARVLAEDQRAACYILATDPRMEAAGVRVEVGSRTPESRRTRITYAGDAKSSEAGVVSISMREPKP